MLHHPVERAKLHGRERVVDRGQGLPAEAAPRLSFHAERARELSRVAVPRRCVAMQAVQEGEEDGGPGAGRILEVLHGRLQGVALEEHAALETAEALRGRARVMADQTFWFEQHPAAG